MPFGQPACPLDRRESMVIIGIRNEWATPEAGTHAWQNWRSYFCELVERKFFAPTPFCPPRIDGKQ
jgi:S-formylglutathione hydrolase FrmB